MNGQGVDKFEFVIGYLKLSGKINYEKDILPLIHQFESMDVDHSGVLDDEELEIAAKKQTEIYESMKDDLNEKLQWAIFLNDYFYIKVFKIFKYCFSSLYQYINKKLINNNKENTSNQDIVINTNIADSNSNININPNDTTSLSQIHTKSIDDIV